MCEAVGVEGRSRRFLQRMFAKDEQGLLGGCPGLLYLRYCDGHVQESLALTDVTFIIFIDDHFVDMTYGINSNHNLTFTYIFF